ncbi:MAG: hypothetical protein ACFFDN_40815 [Candidatus Hodarchaeota archaeon]
MKKILTTKIFRFFTIILLIILVVGISYYFINIYRINKSYHRLYRSENIVGLRKFPYPYRAALSICSDIDNTSTVEEFLKIQEFLNTKNMTEVGEGIGLEIGNSFFMYAKGNSKDFSYLSENPLDRIVIRKFIKAGYIDCLHSFGDGMKDRNDAIIALNELNANNIKVAVWINHAFAKNNLGRWFPTDLGDNIDSEYYHADHTILYGIKFIDLGSSTSIIGQATPINLNMLTRSFNKKYFWDSVRNSYKAFSKHVFSVFGFYQSRYSMHETNDLVKITTLDDGQKVYEFMRFDNHPKGIGNGANSRGTAYNISKRVLEKLKEVNGYIIVYTHLGKNSDCDGGIAEETIEALRHLEKQYRSGEIYVTTTLKLLNYYITHKYLNWTYNMDNEEIVITIHNIDDPIFGKKVPTIQDLQGITFYIPSGKKGRIFINDEEIKTVHNPADRTNRESVTIPLVFLEYPSLAEELTFVSY